MNGQSMLELFSQQSMVDTYEDLAPPSVPLLDPEQIANRVTSNVIQ